MFDQFPYNIFRGSPEAFATDTKALSLSAETIDLGIDRELTIDQRKFLLMPFQHAEDREVRAQSVDLFERLGHDNTLASTPAQKGVIDQFGRFPHRNAILGRESTAEKKSASNS